MPQLKFPELPPYGVLVESHSHGPDFHLGAHSHPFPSLLYIVSGNGEYLKEAQKYAIDANSVILLSADSLHELVDDSKNPMTVFVAYFSAEIATDNESLFEHLSETKHPIPLLPHQADRIRTLLRRMINEQSSRPPEFALSIRLAMERILLDLYRALISKSAAAEFRANDSATRVSAVLDYVGKHPYEPHTLSGAARMANLSQRQFRNICNDIAGCGFTEYLNQLRVDRAVDLLRETNTSVTAIAFQVGYEDLSTFYRAFKKIHEIPPGQFREARKKK